MSRRHHPACERVAKGYRGVLEEPIASMTAGHLQRFTALPPAVCRYSRIMRGELASAASNTFDPGLCIGGCPRR